MRYDDSNLLLIYKTMLKMTDCICYKGAVKKAGKIYLFRRHLVFEAQVFGMKQIVSQKRNYFLIQFRIITNFGNSKR